MKDIPEFVNREKELKQFKVLLSGRPNLLYFVYGPINSGKTTLLMKVFEELPENYRVFYINFRGFEGGYSKFTRVFFRVGDESLWQKIKKNLPFLSAAIEYTEKLLKKVNFKIELPVEVIKSLTVGEEFPEKVDLFDYLESVMRRLKEKNFVPVLVLDEMQVIKDELNTTGMPLLARLFNFLVRMTKETHLCHSLCSTSDCLFIENIYNNARLEGRVRYVLVDDLEKEEAFKVYEEFGFENKELIWNYVGGKFGDLVKLFEIKKEGLSEKEILQKMLKDELGRIRWMLRMIENGEKKGPSIEEIKKVFAKFAKKEKIEESKIKGKVLRFLIEENILFYNPMEGVVRPQSKLVWRAIKKLV